MTPVTIQDFVDRRVGPSTTLVQMDGYALMVPFPAAAPSGEDADPGLTYSWLAVRGELGDPRTAMVRTALLPETLRTRPVVARLVSDPGAVTDALDALGAAGTAHEPLLLDEIEDPRAQDGARSVDSLEALSDMEPGDLVRVQLRFAGGIASCRVAGTCQAQRLAAGIGSWDNLATDAAGTAAVVRTGYPPSVAPFHAFGQQAGGAAEVETLLSVGWIDGMIGWARVLRGAHVEHDLTLPIDRLWLGPTLFAATALLLWLGRRMGYPRFRVTGAAATRWTPAAATGAAGTAIAANATGRITPHGGSPFEVDHVPATLARDPASGDVRLTLGEGGGQRAVTVPKALGSLGSIEYGELVQLHGSRPAMRLNWFGSQVLLVFDTTASRDDAARLVHGDTRS